jgi:RNA polymerase sigma-70 factor (ECF subfamily)
MAARPVSADLALPLPASFEAKRVLPVPERFAVRLGRGPAEVLSFTELYERFQPHVARWVRLSGVAEKDRRDVEQCAWLRIHASLPGYRPDFPIAAWLCTIVRRAAYDHQQRGYVRHEVLDPVAWPLPAETSDDADRRLEGKRLLERALQHLSEDEWTAFVLAEVEGISCREIGEALGVPEPTVTSRLRRARLTIAAELSRMDAADRRRATLAPWAAFTIDCRQAWSRLRAWLDRRFLSGALAGGVVVYWLLRPAAPLPAPTAEARAAKATSAAMTAETVPAQIVTPPSASALLAATAVPAAAPAAIHAAIPAAGSASAAHAGPVSPPPKRTDRERERAADWSALAALEAAGVLLQNGRCEEAGKRLAVHAARLAAGPFAPEYHALQRKVRACPR